MGIINYEHDKQNRTVKESGFQLGDILTGQTHCYRTVTYWYKVIGMTAKQLKLEEMQVSYPTEYMSNTPGSQCMPVDEVKCMRPGGEVFSLDYFCPGFPYYPGKRKKEIVKASIKRFRRIETFPGMDKEDIVSDWIYEAEIIGDRYAPTLELWDGKPGWVNCD